MEGILHDRPVIGLGGSDVGGGAQFAPGPLVVGAAASSVAVRLLTDCIRHDVGPEHGDRQHTLSIRTNQAGDRRAELTQHTNHQLSDQYLVVSDSLSPVSLLINKEEIQ